MNKKLNNRQLAFINEYLQCWNASEAARRAGYKGKANVIGPRLLANVGIAELIERRKREMTMSADEALIRLSEQASATMADFVEIRHGLPFIDLEKAEKAGKLHLLKKFKNTKAGVEIELYDAQSALVHILREQHLNAGEPTERHELTIEERSSRVAALLSNAKKRQEEEIMH